MQIADNEVSKQSLHRILLSCQCNCQIANVIRNKKKILGTGQKNGGKCEQRWSRMKTWAIFVGNFQVDIGHEWSFYLQSGFVS